MRPKRAMLYWALACSEHRVMQLAAWGLLSYLVQVSAKYINYLQNGMRSADQGASPRERYGHVNIVPAAEAHELQMLDWVERFCAPPLEWASTRCSCIARSCAPTAAVWIL